MRYGRLKPCFAVSLAAAAAEPLFSGGKARIGPKIGGLRRSKRTKTDKSGANGELAGTGVIRRLVRTVRGSFDVDNGHPA